VRSGRACFGVVLTFGKPPNTDPLNQHNGAIEMHAVCRPGIKRTPSTSLCLTAFL
jgi:hypothetical protein